MTYIYIATPLAQPLSVEKGKLRMKLNKEKKRKKVSALRLHDF